MKRLITLTFCTICFAGCNVHPPPPEKKLTTSNPAYGIDQLFTDSNGCKIYRFFDQGDYRYYVIGPNGQMLPTTTTVTETDTEIVTVEGGGHDGGHKH